MVWHFKRGVKDFVSSLYTIFSREDAAVANNPVYVANQNALREADELEGALIDGQNAIVLAIREQLNHQHNLELSAQKQALLNRISSQCDSALSDIFNEYMSLNEKLWKELINHQLMK